MKKFLYLLIVFLILSGCGKGDTDTNGGNKLSNKELTNVVIEAQYDYAGEFSEGYAVVGRIFEENMKYNFVDADNELLLEEWVDMAYSFSEGLAVIGVYSENHSNFENVLYEYRYIDTKGDVAIDEMWLGNEEFHPNPFYKGYAEVDFVDPYIYDGVYVLDSLASNVIDKNGHYLFDFNTYVEFGYGYYGGNYNRVIGNEWSYTSNDYAPYHAWMASYVANEKDNILLLNSTYDNAVIVDAKGNVVKNFDSYAYGMYGQDLVLVQNDYYYDLYNYDGQFLVGGYMSYESGLDKQVIAVVGDDWSNCRYVILNEDMSPLNHIPYQFITMGDNYYLAKTDDGSIYKFDVNGNILVEQMPEYNFNSMYIISDYSDGFGSSTNFISASAFDNDSYRNCLFNVNLELLVEDFDYVAPISDDIIGVYYNDKMEFIDVEGNVLNELDGVNSVEYDGNYLRDYNYAETVEYTYYSLDINGKNLTIEKVDEVEMTVSTNQDSTIKGFVDDDLPYSLYDAKGELIDSAPAISLLNDGIYYKASNVMFDEIEYSYVIKDMNLCDVSGYVSETYEELGKISENMLAYQKDGKWGYLIINK